ncbi:MAG: hypothetical protein HYU63_04540 [Armatimonadetes bacterium]|nr:hypothetical protein [Armatimonadota bacterium]
MNPLGFIGGPSPFGSNPFIQGGVPFGAPAAPPKTDFLSSILNIGGSLLGSVLGGMGGFGGALAGGNPLMAIALPLLGKLLFPPPKIQMPEMPRFDIMQDTSKLDDSAIKNLDSEENKTVK